MRRGVVGSALRVRAMGSGRARFGHGHGHGHGHEGCAPLGGGGFTILELLVAMAVFSILGTSLVLILRGGLATWRRAEREPGWHSAHRSTRAA